MWVDVGAFEQRSRIASTTGAVGAEVAEPGNAGETGSLGFGWESEEEIGRTRNL